MHKQTTWFNFKAFVYFRITWFKDTNYVDGFDGILLCPVDLKLEETNCQICFFK